MRSLAIAISLPLALTSVSILGAAAPAGAGTLPAAATGDAHVSQVLKSRNYGGASSLVLNGKTGERSSALVKFRVPSVPEGEKAVGVQLTLRPQTTTSRVVRVYQASNSWSEGSVNWNNAPAAGSLVGTTDGLAAGTPETVNLPLTGFTPGSTVSLRLETTSTTAVRLASSEAGTVSARPTLNLLTETVVVTPPPPPPPPPTPSWPPAGPYAQHVIGMSAPANLWDQRVSEVGADHLNSRRIFGELTSTGTSQLPLIREAIADGMTPVISYKVPNVDSFIAGDYDAWMVNLRRELVALNANVTVTFWHEPHGDMDPAKFRAASLRFFNAVDAPSIAVGPILNGWLLDRRVADFASYTDATLLDKWEFMGVDSYQEGTASNPSSTLLPARAVPKVAAWLDTQGQPDMPIVLGEYNGFSGAAMAQAGEYILSTPELWIANVWNVDHTTFSVLTGERLTAFRATKSDPRVVD